MAATKTDGFAWVSVPAHKPSDGQLVYARAQHGQPRPVTFYSSPRPRWEGANIVYDFLYFAEWAALEQARKPARRSK